MSRAAPSETDIAAVVIAWLEALGADVYQEVELPHSHQRADIVARLRKELWVVETKARMSLELVEQALERRRFATRVYIAAPLRRARGGRAICAELGLGLLGVEPATALRRCIECDSGVPLVIDPVHGGERHATGPICRRLEEPPHVDEVCESRRWNRRPAELAAVLCPEHKTHARAGAATGGHWTPFRATVERLARRVADEPGLTLKAAIDGLQHHYSSKASARSSLAHWIDKGKVPGVELRDGLLFPTESVH